MSTSAEAGAGYNKSEHESRFNAHGDEEGLSD